MTTITGLIKPKQKNKSKTQNDDPQAQFQNYWEKIERAEKAYTAAERQRKKIVDQFNDELLSLEKRHNAIRYQFIDRLLTFFNKRGLTKLHKDLLLDWVTDEMDELMSSPFRGELDTDKLIEQIQSLMAPKMQKSLSGLKEDIASFASEEMGLDDEAIEDICDSIQDGPQGFFEALMRNAAKMFDDLPDDKVDFEEFVHDYFSDEAGFEHYRDEADTSKDIFSKKTLNKLYKKLAQKLHPDRAASNLDREKKHELMMQLSEAKRSQDIFTLFTLYQTYGDDKDFSFAEKEIEEFNKMLSKKLQALRGKKKELKQDGGVESLIYKKFHSRSKKEMAQKFLNHKNILVKKIKALESQVNHMTSLKKLKEELQIRQSFSIALDDFLFS